MDVNKCPRCVNIIDNKNRLIYESCGHYKCRKCFLQDEVECLQCISQSLLPLDHKSASKEVDETSCNTNREEESLNNDSSSSSTNMNQKNLIRKQKHNKISFPNHIRVNKVSDGSSSFTCGFCEKTFKSRNQVYYHLYCDNIEKSPFKCKICNKIFLSAYHLNYHLESHNSSAKTHQCKKCNKNFSRLQSLKRHLREHEISKKYECSDCPATFKSKTAFDGHVQVHKNLFSNSCPYCGKYFTITSNYKQHLQTHSDKGNAKFKCNECSKEFFRKSSYNEHLTRHKGLKLFSCAECKKSFIDKKTLERHKNVHEGATEINLYKCSLCGIKSNRKDNLLRHLRNMHSDVKSKTDIICCEKQQTKVIINENKINNLNNAQEEECHTLNSYENTSRNEIHEDQSKKNNIVINSSVIRSIGNVEPVIIPIETNLNTTIHYPKNNCNTLSNSKLKVINKEMKKSLENGGKSNNSIKPQTTTTKKAKKKYDPCEIYRKILMASSDEDSIAESEDHATEEHSSCCNNVTARESDNNQIPTIVSNKKTDLCPNSNFAEIHWRKRTSQYFLNMFD